MAKQLNVNLAFTADTGRAKAQLQDLQNQLTKLMNTSVSNVGTFGITNNIIEASQAAATLKVNLQEATNVNTGKLDLGKFKQQMQQSGMSLQKYRDALVTLGPDGTQAFASLATSITQAEIPLRRSNALLMGMWTTLKNTARWQISSSILHGFMGTVQSAYGYAKDLNESLNNIRIVTGQNTDQMAKFADEANKAAKVLSTTTTAYTNASLIYYQQGLSDQEVLERTDTTIKMANVAGESAEIVSDQMTAVWNNFDDGSKSLEYYADVMTALGATTASSTAEIAEGLEKFAAISETVGLSYEYATSALATVTATTRQSADVVGTAFKTLFARIQGLNLGQTLDDGTTLNKYSEALNKVGISIFEQNGEMKEMDAILDEMGAKWQTLNKDQQTALAQTVAGVRQYTQLMALMDNWDFFQENLETAYDSTGTLERQAQIYAESWEAASKRVKASAEAIYSALLDDKFFIDLTDFGADFLDTIKNTIDSLGGLKGTLLTISSIITVTFRDQIAKSIQNTIYNLRMMTETGRKSVQQIRNDANKILIDSVTGLSTAGGQAQGKAYTEQANLQKAYIANAKSMDQVQQKIAQTLLDQQGVMVQNIALQGQELEKVEQKALLQERTVNGIIANTSDKIVAKGLTNVKNDLIETAKATGYLESLIPNLSSSFKKIDSTNVEKFRLAIQNLEKEAEDAGFDIRKAFSGDTEKAFSNLLKCVNNSKVGVDGLNKAFDKFISSAQNTGQINLDPLINALQAANVPAERAREIAQQLADTYYRLGFGTQELALKTNDLTEYTKRVGAAMIELSQKNYTAGQAITALAGTMSSVAMSITSIINLMDTWNNKDLSGAEKLLATMTTLGIVIPTVTRSLSAENIAILALASNSIRGAVGLEAVVVEEGKVVIASTKAAASIWSILGPIAAVAAAGVALTIGIKAVVDWTNRYEIAADRAADAANELADSASKAKNALQDRESSFEGYNSLVEKLNALDNTSVEWHDTLKDINSEILSIIEKYPELAKMPDLFDNKGLLNDKTIDNFIKNAEKFANITQVSSIAGQAKASDAAAQAKKIELASNIELNLNNIADWQAEPIEGQAAGSLYIYGEEIVDTLVGILNNDEIENSSEIFQEKLKSYAKDLGISEAQQQLFTDSLIGMSSSIIDIAKEIADAGTQINNVSSILASQYLGNNPGAGQSEEWQSAFNDAKNNYKGGSGINRVTQATDTNLTNLLKDAGITQAVSTSNAVIKENGVLKVQFENGELQTLESIITQAATNTAINVANEMIVTGEGENTTFSQLSNKGVNLQQNVDTALANDLLNRLNNKTIDPENINEIIKSINSQDTALGQEEVINEILAIQTNVKDKVNVANESEKYDLEAENVKYYANSLLDLAEASEEANNETNGVSKDLKDNADMAGKVAIANSRMNKGLITLAENFADYRKTITTAEKGTEEYNTALKGISDAMNDVLGLDDVELSDDFLTNTTNLDLMAQAANGSAEAVEQLRAVAAQDIIQNIELNDESLREDLITKTQELQTLLDQTDLSIGATFDNTEALTGLNELISASGMTAEQVQDYFNALGYTPEIEYTEGTQKQHYQGIIPYLDANGEPDYKPYDFEVEETVQIPTIKSLTYHGDAGKTINTGAIKKAGGGSTKKPSKVDKTKKSDVVDRYKEVNDQIDDLEDSLDDAGKAADRLFGSARIKALEKEKNLLKDQIPLLEKKRDEAKAYLAIDKQLLMDTGKKYGITFETDGAGNITNYTEKLTKLYDELAAAEEKMNSLSADAQDAYQESTLDPLNEKIEELKDAIAQYDETRELLEDLEDEITDAFNAWQDKNYEILTYKLELELELNEADLQEIEFELSLLEDDFYKMAEAAALMKDQIDPLNDSLSDLDNHFEDLTDAYEDGEISQVDYIDGLKETRDSIYDQLNALVDLDKEMMEYYGNTLDAAMEELDKYTDHMEHLTGVIDHYISLMELIGKSTDFEAMDEFLSARAETTKNELEVAKSNYEMLARQKAQIEERMAGTREGSAEWELYKKEWDAIVATMDEAQDEMLSKTEEWMEAMKAVIENNMNKAAKSLEDALTNGMSFDHMMTELDRLNERQEEYLTKTNQVYETNKLMRAAAQAADKTDNAVAKQKFKNFAEETKQLQEKGQLSKYELEIQQAKYDLLLAEIALEDAQNAKSTVRLQRDSEGNFGYVYTADQDKISEAQQAVEDAENDLYNISLNGQQEYTEKYTQALQSMYDEMKALQEAYLAGDIATEQEYQARKEALMQHYFGVPDGILTTYSNLYNVAVQTDADATADFWAKSYGDMTADTEEFKTAVNGYLVEIETETEIWHDITKAAQEDITEGLDDLVDESEEYADVVDDEVIPALEDELDAVEDLTAGYADQRDEVLRLIQTYKQLVQAINAAIAAAARQSGSSRSSSGDLSLDAANAFLAGEDTSGILAERGEKMAGGNHPVATDNEDLTDLFEAAEGGDQDAIDIITEVAGSGGKKKFHDYDLSSFDTGGYTGEWGPQAKLAFVHEKEIMLNSDDTVNFLSAIKITRSIMELIDKQAGWASAGLGIMSASGVQDYNQVLEQEVTIHAEFPNATDHNEIEEAFNNLMNTASQYANRKNR